MFMVKKVKQISRPSVRTPQWIIILLSLAVIGLTFAFIQSRSQANVDKLNYQAQLAHNQCDNKGNPAIDVTQKVTNDADSGQAGNYWALDNFSRHIQVYKQSDATYCVIVDYNGTFVGQAGQTSPGATGTLTGSEKGTIHGGYRAIINGVLLANPSLPIHGAIGPTDYQCDLSGNCPGAFNWTTKYFNTNASNFAFNYEWWGWTYKNAQHTWINASTGNSGDVM